MSHSRLASISLILVALGLNLAPATAADPKPDAAAAAAAAAAKDTLRPEIIKLLEQGAFRDGLTAKKFGELTEHLAAADALPNLTPFEQYYIERLRLLLAITTNDQAQMVKSFEKVIAAKRLEPKDQQAYIMETGSTYYRMKNYPKAIEWFKRYRAEAPAPGRSTYLIALSHYQLNDFASVKAELMPEIDANIKAGKASPEDALRLVAVATGKLKDWPTYLPVLEQLVTYYPSDEVWSDMLKRVLVKPSFNQNLTLDLFRLQQTATKTMEQEYYTEMAELALAALFPAEAKKALDAGFANGTLGVGQDAAKHKSLRDKAAKAAADDQKNLAASDAAALKSKDGIGMINLGYTYVTMDQFDKGIDMIEKGIAKGMPAKVEPVKGKVITAPKMRLEDAKLRLGTAYAKAGRKDDAIKVFSALKGDDGIGDLARYWIMWLNRPAPAAPEAAPAAAK